MEVYNSRNQQDNAWKDILDAYFKECLHYCLPKLAEQINWNLPFMSLDKELTTISKHTETGICVVDKLFKVHLINGIEQWILIHIEIQGTKNDVFPERMFTYAYRIWDKYQKSIVSCAILTDDNKNWRPTNYENKFIDFLISLPKEFEIEYRNEIDKLEENKKMVYITSIERLGMEKGMEIGITTERENGKIKYAKRMLASGIEISLVLKSLKFP